MPHKKTNDDIANAILKKCRYTIEIEEGTEEDYDEDGEYNGDPSEVGYFWQDMNGDNADGYWDNHWDAVKNALENLDTEGTKLTKVEQKFLSKYQ